MFKKTFTHAGYEYEAGIFISPYAQSSEDALLTVTREGSQEIKIPVRILHAAQNYIASAFQQIDNIRNVKQDRITAVKELRARYNLPLKEAMELANIMLNLK
jgi:hypothetical protein